MLRSAAQTKRKGTNDGGEGGEGGDGGLRGEKGTGRIGGGGGGTGGGTDRWVPRLWANAHPTYYVSDVLPLQDFPSIARPALALRYIPHPSMAFGFIERHLLFAVAITELLVLELP